MPFIKLKKNWFGPEGVRYKARDGLIQVSEEIAAQAPTSAEIFDDNGKSLPSRSPVPRPGHGAKPIEEQRLDLIPGGAPTHLISQATGTAPAPGLLDEDDLKAVEESRKKRAALRTEQAKTTEHKEEQETINKMVDVAQAQEIADKQATDPVAVASGQVPASSSAPKPVATPTKK